MRCCVEAPSSRIRQVSSSLSLGGFSESWPIRLRVAVWVSCLIAALSSRAAVADEQSEEPGEQPGASAATYPLAYQFEPGQRLRWEVVHRATIKTTIQGTTQTAKTKSESVKVWQMEEAPETEEEITFTHLVESVKMVNEISGRAQVEYDSEKDAAPPAGFADVAKAIGVPLTVFRIDRQGKVLHREEKHVQPGAQGDTPIAIPLPADPVPIGHVWSEPHEVRVMVQGGSNRAINTRRRLELASVQSGIAVIKVDYQILTPVNDPAVEAQLVQRLASGEVRFDIDAGRVVSQQMDVDKHVLGFSGPTSSMHYLMRFTERLLAPGERIAKQPPRRAGPEPPPKRK